MFAIVKKKKKIYSPWNELVKFLSIQSPKTLSPPNQRTFPLYCSLKNKINN